MPGAEDAAVAVAAAGAATCENSSQRTYTLRTWNALPQHVIMSIHSWFLKSYI